MTTVNEEGKALVEQSTFDKSKALADFMEYIHTYLTDDECDQVLKATARGCIIYGSPEALN